MARRRWFAGSHLPLVGATLIFMAVTLVGTPSAAAAAGVSGPVVIEPSTVGADIVEFSYPTSTPSGDARANAQRVLQTAGLTPGAATVTTDGGRRVVDISCRLSARTGTLRWQVRSSVFARLAEASGQPVEVQLALDARPVGQRLHLVSGGLKRRYAEPAGAPLNYRVLPSALWGYLIVLLAAFAVPFMGLRRLAARVESRTDDQSRAVHYLRVLTTVATLAGLLILPVMLITGWVAVPGQLAAQLLPGLMAPHVAKVTAVDVAILVPYLLVAAASTMAVRPAYNRLRGLVTTKSRAGRQVAALLAFIVPVMVYSAVAQSVHGAAGFLTPVIYVALMWSLFPLLWLRILRTRPAGASLDTRIRSMLDRHGVKVRAVRLMKGRDEKIANAMVLGMLPHVRYVVISDYLIDHFDEAEVEAVVAHEAGHLRHHHLPLKMAALIAGAALGAVVAAVVAALLRLPAVVVPVGLVIGLVGGVLVVPGLIGLRLEERADDFAVEAAGADALRRALTHLAELNMTPHRTGRAWNLLTQHPGMEERIARLQSTAGANRPVGQHPTPTKETATTSQTGVA